MGSTTTDAVPVPASRVATGPCVTTAVQPSAAVTETSSRRVPLHVGQLRTQDRVREGDGHLPRELRPDGVAGLDDARRVGGALFGRSGVGELALLGHLQGAGVGLRGRQHEQHAAADQRDQGDRTRTEGGLTGVRPDRHREGGRPAGDVAPGSAEMAPDRGAAGVAGHEEQAAHEEDERSGRGERVEGDPAPGDAEEQAAQDLVLRRLVLVEPVVVVALRHEPGDVRGDDAVHDDRVHRFAAVGDDVAHGVPLGGAQDRQVPGVEPGSMLLPKVDR